MITVSTFLGSMPAAARLVWNWADRALALLIHAETEPGVDHDEF